jgi:RsiW-degrading membrane proteinase PrsW (M82 family)
MMTFSILQTISPFHAGLRVVTGEFFGSTKRGMTIAVQRLARWLTEAGNLCMTHGTYREYLRRGSQPLPENNPLK